MAAGFKRDFQLTEERKALLAKRKWEQIEAERSRMDRKANLLLIERRLHMERKEAEMEENLTKARESELIRAAQKEQEEKLAFEMSRLHHQEVVEMKLRQKLRESSQELKELESKLRAAYVTKQLAAQLAEKEVSRMEDKIQEKKIYEMLEAERLQAEQKRLQDVESELAKKRKYKQELQDQMIYEYKKQQAAYQEFLREKAMLDDIVRLIHEEDEKEEELKMMKLKKTKHEMEEFRRIQDAWRQKEKEAVEEEDRRLTEYLEKRQKEEKLKLEEAQKREEAKIKLQETVAQAIGEDVRKRLEKEEICRELVELERKERDQKKQREDMEKAFRNRIELRESFNQQLRERWERLKEEEEQEALYKQKLLEKFAEDQKLDQLTAERRRMKMLEYKSELHKELEDKHKRRLQEMHELMAYDKAQKEEETNRRKLVEEERLRILKEHASKLIGYLPRGVLREDDFIHLGPDFMEELNKFNAMNVS